MIKKKKGIRLWQQRIWNVPWEVSSWYSSGSIPFPLTLWQNLWSQAWVQIPHEAIMSSQLGKTTNFPESLK
jgi:hypothetical protein